MTTITGHKARDRLDQLIDDATASHVPVTIIGKRHDAVLISAEDWASIQETLHPTPAEPEWLARGLASRDEAKHTGEYFDADGYWARWTRCWPTQLRGPGRQSERCS